MAHGGETRMALGLIPGDEERQPAFGERERQSCRTPGEQQAIGTHPRPRFHGEPEPPSDGVQIRGRGAPAHETITGGNRVEQRAPEEAAVGLSAVHDAEQLEIDWPAERHDPVRRAEPEVPTATDDAEPKRLEASRRDVEVPHAKNDVVDGQHAAESIARGR